MIQLASKDEFFTSLGQKVVVTTTDDFPQTLLSLLGRESREAILRKGQFKLVLSGGSLIDICSRINWSHFTNLDKWIIILADERCVSIELSESTFGEYSRQCPGLFGQAQFPAKKAYFLDDKHIPDFEAYRSSALGETLELPDLVLLGVGPDGHTASIFPPVQERTLENDAFLIEVFDAPKPPPHRLSLSLSYLIQCRKVLFIASGISKQKILEQILVDKDCQLPVAFITWKVPQVGFLLDHEAWNYQ